MFCFFRYAGRFVPGYQGCKDTGRLLLYTTNNTNKSACSTEINGRRYIVRSGATSCGHSLPRSECFGEFSCSSSCWVRVMVFVMPHMTGLGDFATNSAIMFTRQTTIPYKGFPQGKTWLFHTSDMEALLSEYSRDRPAGTPIAALGREWWQIMLFMDQDRGI